MDFDFQKGHLVIVEVGITGHRRLAKKGMAHEQILWHRQNYVLLRPHWTKDQRHCLSLGRFPSIGKHSSPFLRNRLQKCYCRWSVGEIHEIGANNPCYHCIRTILADTQQSKNQSIIGQFSTGRLRIDLKVRQWNVLPKTTYLHSHSVKVVKLQIPSTSILQQRDLPNRNAGLSLTGLVEVSLLHLFPATPKDR